jgi:hypothetical protein
MLGAQTHAGHHVARGGQLRGRHVGVHESGSSSIAPTGLRG